MKDKQGARNVVGFIVGRFQVDELTLGHEDLFDHVIKNHEKVVACLGLSPCKCTVNNPMDFETRRLMLQEKYPGIQVVYVKDVHSNELWSKQLDEKVSDVIGPNETAHFYGSRDSFIPYYSGKYPCSELKQKSFTSGSDRRRKLSSKVKASPDFRHGVIWATMNQYPKCLSTVDSAIFNDDKTDLLLARKPNEDKFRFVGGFVMSGETHDAAVKRETKEETHLTISEPTYVGSFVIDDWRYRSEVDKITSILFESVIEAGRPSPDDDICELRWFTFDRTILDTIRPEHLEMATALLERHGK